VTSQPGHIKKKKNGMFPTLNVKNTLSVVTSDIRKLEMQTNILHHLFLGADFKGLKKDSNLFL